VLLSEFRLLRVHRRVLALVGPGGGVPVPSRGRVPALQPEL